MRFSSSTAIAALASVAAAETINVWVGVDANNDTALAYNPEKVEAAVGDVIEFIFVGGNHTATQSTFADPCVFIDTVNATAAGFRSGFQPVAADATEADMPVSTLEITSEAPVWIYCGQGQHCAAGMVMVINEQNAASADSTLENYKSAAAVAQSEGGDDAPDSTSGGDATPTAEATPEATTNAASAMGVSAMIAVGALVMAL